MNSHVQLQRGRKMDQSKTIGNHVETMRGVENPTSVWNTNHAQNSHVQL